MTEQGDDDGQRHTGGGNTKGRRAGFGSVRKLASGRFQARYTGDDGNTYTARTSDGRALTFETKGDAQAWLSLRQSERVRNVWRPPAVTAAPITFRDYSAAWLAERDLQVGTRELYASLLRTKILPTFGDQPVTSINPAAVRTWYSTMGRATPTSRAQAYALLRSILGTAVADELLDANPCRIRGAGQSKAAKTPRPATLDELTVLVAAMPARYRTASLLACWCSLRFGEVAGLRRGDVDLDARVIRVRRAISDTTSEGRIVKAPKSAAGIRDVTIPQHIVEDLSAHLETYAGPGPDGVVFPTRNGTPVSHSTMLRHHDAARTAAGRPDLTFHGLRHTGQTFSALAGASLRELMGRAGQSTPNAALRYLHEVDGRQQEIADRLSAFATGTSNVRPITSKATKIPVKTRKRARPGRAGA